MATLLVTSSVLPRIREEAAGRYALYESLHDTERDDMHVTYEKPSAAALRENLETARVA